MKIVCAPDSFKECLTAGAAARAMVTGIGRADPAIIADACPVGDGGEGTLEVLVEALAGRLEHGTVLGPLGEPVEARYGRSGDGRIAIVGLAEASGLALVPAHRREPAQATTFGTGQLIDVAIKRGAREVIVCLGGSATVDGGTGIAQALGARFFDRYGSLINEPIRGRMLGEVSRYEPPAIAASSIVLRAACDVTNPLCGPRGAAAVYGPQKGATPQQVGELDAGLAHLATLVGGDPDQPGAGAAGGAAFGLAAMCGSTLERGIDLVLQAVHFQERCAGASLAITGEGRLDTQSLQGKATLGVAAAAAQLGVPTIAIVGDLGSGHQQCIGEPSRGLLKQAISLTERFGRDRAVRDAATLIAEIAGELTAKVGSLRPS